MGGAAAAAAAAAAAQLGGSGLTPQQQEQLFHQLRELRIPLLPILTEQDPLKRLLTVFPAR